MICPYCASEYEGSMCPRCGGKAQAEENAIVCPYCDSVHTGGPRCNRCGADLLSIFAPPPLPEPPVGKYKGTIDYFEMHSDRIVLYNKSPFQEVMKREIAYFDVSALYYQECKRFKPGLLSVRSRTDTDKPITNHKEALFDASSVCFSKLYEEEFKKAYLFLKQCVQRNEILRLLSDTTEE